MHYLTLLAFNSVHGVACVLCPPCNKLDATNFDFESIGNRIGNRLLRRGYCIASRSWPSQAARGTGRTCCSAAAAHAAASSCCMTPSCETAAAALCSRAPPLAAPPLGFWTGAACSCNSDPPRGPAAARPRQFNPRAELSKQIEF